MPQPEITAAPVPPRDGKVHVRVLYNSQWEAEGKRHFVYNLHFTNMSNADIDTPFDIEILGPKIFELGEAWNMSDAKIDGDKVVAKVTSSWASLPSQGRGTTNLGFIGISDAQDGSLKSIKVAGQDAVLEH